MENFCRKKHSPIVQPIEKIVKETRKIKSFYLNSRKIASEAEPGQYLMLWVLGKDEIPISMSMARKDGTLGLTVEKVGDATSALHELQVGDKVGVRGPYGNGFDLNGDNLLLVCGGCGTAPLTLSAERAVEMNKNVTVVLAAKKEEDLLFTKRLDELGVNSLISTEDGSKGIKGLATDALKSGIVDWDFDSCLICGPERMMEKTTKLVDKKGVPIQVSLDRYIKCGIGLCGQCSIDPDGIRVCQEGPVFEYEEIEDSEFGKYRRNAEGKKVKF